MTLNSHSHEPNLADEPGVARALHVTLIASLVSAVAVASFTFLLGWTFVPILCLLSAATTLAALVLSHFGWKRTGIFLALGGIALVVMYSAAKNDGMQSIGLAIIPVLIVISSMLLGRWTFALFNATAIAATVVMLGIRYYVLRVENYNQGDLGDFFIFAVTCIVAGVVGRLLSARIQQGFVLVRASEHRYRRVFENIQDMYYEMRTDGTLLEVSPAGAALLGVPPQEIIGSPFALFCTEQLDFDRLIASILRHGRVSNRELVLRGPRTAPVHALVSASLQEGGEAGEPKIIGSIRDITDRRRAEEALRDSEARLRLAIEATGIGTFDFFPETEKLIWSDITKGHFGMSPDAEIDHETFLRAVHPDDRERVRQAGIAVSNPASGGRLVIEYRTIGVEDGAERWIAVRGRMLYEGKRPVRLIGTTLDISKRKRLEEELRRRAEELQKVMDVAPVALFTANNPECSEVTVNRTGNTMMEAPEGAHSASAPGGSMPPCPFFRNGVQVPIEDLPLQTAARGVEVRDAELEVLLPSGRRRLLWGHASPLRDAEGRVRGAIAAVQDVTEVRQRADALLRESEERFRNTADAAPVIIWFGDTEKRVTFVNESFLKFTGLPAEQLLGDGWAQVIHPDDLDLARTVYYRGVDSRTSYQLEYRARRADGEYRHMLGTTRPRYVGNDYAGQVGSVIDITELKRRQEEDVARQKLESVGMLASGIAHDFNNLMGGVLAQAELAAEEIAEGIRPDEELKKIGEIAKRGSAIVRQLMIYAGKEKGAPPVADVSEIVKGMLDLLSVSISKHAALKTELRDNLPPVRADAAQIQQIVMNLVANASEAIGERDAVIYVTTGRVTVGPDRPGAIGARLPAGEYLELEVSDTGCGMSVETRASMFDPFYTTKSAGRGLGLAVVQGIVRSLGGSIHVTSEPNKGSSFRILLPCLDIAASAAGVPLYSDGKPSGPPGQATILIVEDEHLLRESVAKMLRRMGFSILEAGDGTAALEAIQSYRDSLDMVFLDITLPGASSRSVFEEAKRSVPGIKVVVTSAYSEHAAASSLQRQIEHFIRKPYRIGDLVEIVREALAPAGK